MVGSATEHKKKTVADHERMTKIGGLEVEQMREWRRRVIVISRWVRMVVKIDAMYPTDVQINAAVKVARRPARQRGECQRFRGSAAMGMLGSLVEGGSEDVSRCKACNRVFLA